jgi:LacI family transcriptional regulator
MAVSVKQVAARAGVSLGTVSNVLNRPDSVAPGTRQRVLDAIAELGFVRNEAARALRAGRSRSLGLVVLDVSNPFFTDVAAGVEAVADAHGMTIALCNSGDSREREGRHLAHLAEQRVQGVLITPVETDDRHLSQLIDRGIPVVLVDREARRRTRCSVAVDDVEGGRLVAAHLSAQGHRRLAFVGGPVDLQQVADRRRGFADGLALVGASPEVVPTEALSLASGVEAGERILAAPRSRRPTAVFCANDLLALGVLQVLIMNAVRVPEDVALVGYDDISFAAAAAVPLTSVRQPRDLLGRTAAELLLEEIEKPEGHRHNQVQFSPELVVRASTDVRRRPRRSSVSTGVAPLG